MHIALKKDNVVPTCRTVPRVGFQWSWVFVIMTYYYKEHHSVKMSYMCHNELFPDFPCCFSGINPPALSRQHRSLLSLVLAGIRMQIMRNCPPVKLHIYESERRGLGVQEVLRVKSNHKWENAHESTPTCTNCRGAQWQATRLHFRWKRCQIFFQCNVPISV